MFRLHARLLLVSIPLTWPAVAVAQAPATVEPGPCSGMVDSALKRAGAAPAEAGRTLTEATERCPKDSAGWRELAELRLHEYRYRAAAAYARKAAALDPEDDRSWALTGQSRYLAGDVLGALRAWNHIGQPVTSSVEIHGARKTRADIVQKLVGIQPGEMLSADAFIRAAHRLEQLPVSFATRVKYAPIHDGTVRVDVYIDERDVVPKGAVPIAAVGAGGLIFQDLRFDIAGPKGLGEDWTFSWGWEADWRHVRVGLDVPAPGALPGIISISAFREEQEFAPAPGVHTRGDRESLGFNLGQWATSWLYWNGGVALDRFEGASYAGFTGELQARTIRDHVSLNLQAGRWLAGSSHQGFGNTAAWISTRSTTRVDRQIWLTTFGVADASEAAPYQLWRGAGASQTADAYLRAHPLIRRGAVIGEAFGRGLEFGSIEYDHPFWQSPAGPVQWAAFVDAAHAWERAGNLPPTPLLIDVGMGLRLRPPAMEGTVRFDVARGVRDGGWRASVSLMPKWPRR